MPTFTDSVNIKLPNKDNDEIKMRIVAGALGLKWSLRAQIKNEMLSVYMKIVGGSVTVNAKLFVSYPSRPLPLWEPHTNQIYFVKDGEHTVHTSSAGANVDVIIQCYVTFECMQWTKREILAPLTVREMIDPSDSRFSDATIKVGKGEFKINRGFLSLISPVFNAAFAPHTKEAQTGIYEIEDFSFETVKTAIDYCYGNECVPKSAAAAIDMLRFYDKYDIPAAIKKLEVWLVDNMTVENFAPIAAYAWQYSRESLQAKCGKVYRDNIAALACNSAFARLDSTVIAGVVRAGAATSNNN